MKLKRLKPHLEAQIPKELRQVREFYIKWKKEEKNDN